ncbi:solute carrier family 25 member 35 [Protopterus annectens]|uniref:solute carrier family 25 member 35 n=1 Tax=Protopterus annectens TaxID=7888 RepID=UPI001CFA2D18|nr:solute carrier family 25 member 35 [Protopterus annectens]
MEFFMSGLAACGACIFSNPLEVVKTRMQVQGELKAPGSYQVYYRNVFHAFYTIGKLEGLAGLQRGLAPGLLYQFTMNGIRLGSYSIMDSTGYIHTNGQVSVMKSTLAGAVAGVVGAMVGSPMYLVKTHLQTQSLSEIAVGHQYQHKGTIHAFLSIYKAHGIIGLWRGCSASVPRVMVGSAVQLSTFSTSKELVNELMIFPSNSWLVALCAAMMSSMLVVLVMTPFDVISTRIYNQPVDHAGKGLQYKGYVKCMSDTVKHEGIHGLYKGIGASYFRLGPHTILSLVFWNELLKLSSTTTHKTS